MDSGEPIVDFQSGAMDGVNRAVDHCTIQVIDEATFTVLTFRNGYDPTRRHSTGNNPAQAVGSVASESVSDSISFPSTIEIKGVKSYQLATGTIIAYHYKN